MGKNTRRLVSESIIILLCLAGPFSVSAGINEYNAAMKRGDIKTAAAETISAWKSIDKTRPYAPSVAREFAFINYLSGNFDSARTFIGYLTGGKSKLAYRDNNPAVSRILADLINYNRNPDKQARKELLSSLNKRLKMPGADIISITASEFLNKRDWINDDWPHTIESSAVADKLMDRGGYRYLVQKRRVELFADVANFLQGPGYEDYYHLVDLQNTMVSDIDSSKNSKQRDSLLDLRWQAIAWIDAMWAYFQGAYKQTGSRISSNIQRRKLNKTRINYYADDIKSSDSRPLCDAEVFHKNIEYPISNEFKGFVGSVILKMDFDEKGKSTNPVILASVPNADFGKSVMNAARTFRKVEKKDQASAGCRLAQKNDIILITFQIY